MRPGGPFGGSPLVREPEQRKTKRKAFVMAKAKKENGASRKVNRHVPEGVVVPSGYQKQSTDIVGFWDQESSPAIHFIPLEAKVFDSQLDKSKPSTLVIGKL